MKLSTLLMLTNCLCLSVLLFTPGCSKQLDDTPSKNTQATAAISSAVNQNKSTHTFNLDLENTSGKTLYTCCFTYAKKTKNALWRWQKSGVFMIEDDATATIPITVFNDIDDIEHTFGTLGIFNTQEEANAATYELLPDKQKLDLDLLYKLANKKITLCIEAYGIKRSFYDYSVTDSTKPSAPAESSFFNVHNNTKKPIRVCFFSYEHRNEITVDEESSADINRGMWRYYKSDVILIASGATQKINLPSQRDNLDNDDSAAAFLGRPGYLGIFDENEQTEAESCTFELLPENKKLPLGGIAGLHEKTIELTLEQYGVKNNIIDFVVKPTQRINLKTIHFQGNEEL